MRLKPMTHTIDLEAQPTSLDELLTLMEGETEILLTRGNVPIARLSAVILEQTQSRQRIPGLGKGSIHTRDDFDDPLPDSFWLGEE